jgi:type IV pilus assembly protein PilA
MLKSAQKATRGEGGFTLIELLVVMIIIAILMAVAVPTFLKQKQNAVGTKAKANIKQIVTAVESCAASNVNGTYDSPTNCVDPAIIKQQEPVVGELFDQSNTNSAGETYTLAGGAQTYTVTAEVASSDGTTTFTEVHNTDGTVVKTCTPFGPTSKMCPTEQW